MLEVLVGAGAVMAFTSQARAVAPIAWQASLDDAVFARAAREQRFVILDLHAVWCHWCHVMDAETYGDARVQSLIGSKYLAVSVDADSNPALTSRYGDWGWPATIVLAADGTEIVKRRGYIPAAQMASLLQAIIDDPSPGPSVRPAAAMSSKTGSRLRPLERAALNQVYEDIYDDKHGGWGDVHKFIDAASLELSYSKFDAGDATAEKRARQTLDANLQLLDPVWGGVYQYSDSADWRSPHFEKLISFQADDLRLYSEAYARWNDARYLAAAKSLYGYMMNFLAAPDGGFYSSQDADLSPTITGRDFYARADSARRALGMPAVDRHEYARETGWAIRALCKYYDITGDESALDAAKRAARWALAKRAIAGGGFSHAGEVASGPYLDDSLAMGAGFVALYRSSGERGWLRHGSAVLDFVDTHLRDSRAGFIAAPRRPEARGVFRDPVRDPAQNAELVRVANLLARYTGDPKCRRIAAHGMRYLAAYAAANPSALQSELLLADGELSNAPIHITVVGSKGDGASKALHAAALRYPADYLQVDWWDPQEGRLPNHEIQYPQLDRPAAFACSSSACSAPVFDAAGIAPAVRAALAR